MSTLPENVKVALENREGPVVLATVDKTGVPNIIYVTCVGFYGDEHLVIADNHFNKTRLNVRDGGIGAILFIDKTGKTYQIKGTVKYHTQGAVFDSMQKWNSGTHSGHAALALHVENVFSGSVQIL